LGVFIKSLTRKKLGIILIFPDKKFQLLLFLLKPVHNNIITENCQKYLIPNF